MKRLKRAKNPLKLKNMIDKEQDQQHLDLAIQEVASFLRVLSPVRDSSFVVNMLMKRTVERFHSHLSRIQSVHILEIADWEFEVTVNGHVRASLVIEKREGGDA